MSMKRPSRDITMNVGYGDLRCTVIAEGVSWSPDVADDMVKRMKSIFDSAMFTLYEYGAIGDTEDDDEEYGPTPESELIEPHVVYVREEDNG